MSADTKLGAWPSPSGLKERQADDQRKHEPEVKAPQEGDWPAEVETTGVGGTSGRSIHPPSIADLAVVITFGLAQIAWIILLIYATYWLLAIRL